MRIAVSEIGCICGRASNSCLPHDVVMPWEFKQNGIQHSQLNFLQGYFSIENSV